MSSTLPPFWLITNVFKSPITVKDEILSEPRQQSQKSERVMVIDKEELVDVEEQTPSFFNIMNNENNNDDIDAQDKCTEKSCQVEDDGITVLYDSLQNYHQIFQRVAENPQKESIPHYRLLESIDKQAIDVLYKEDKEAIENDSVRDESFDYIDAKEFYMKGKSYLKRSCSLKQIKRASEKEYNEKEFYRYYQSYLMPMREKIQEYAEKINSLVKEKELEFYTQNEIIQRLISDFSNERQMLEAELFDKNLIISKMRATDTPIETVPGITFGLNY